MTPALSLLYGLLAFATFSLGWPVSSPNMNDSIRSRQATRSSVLRQLDPSRTRRRRDTASPIVYPTCLNSPLAGTGNPWSAYSGQTVVTVSALSLLQRQCTVLYIQYMFVCDSLLIAQDTIDWSDTTESSCRTACTNSLSG
jgi:hypothetical protein